MKIFAIGDIHGCLNQLIEMFEIIDERVNPAEDVIVMIGDYIDRGPDSKGVVDYLIMRQKMLRTKHVFLKGNHEDMMLDAQKNPIELHGWALMMGSATAASYGCEPDSFILPEDHQKFYDQLKLYFRCGKFVFVHGGLDPSKLLEEQSEQILLWDRRYVGYDGDYLGGYTVIYGHTPKDRPVIRRNQYGIDTGCVFGNMLTCIELDTENDSYTLHQVLNQKDHTEW